MIQAQPTLLITDDDRAVRESISTVFERHGFNTRLAADGQSAIEIAQKSEVHVVLMDMHMPRISGIETVRRLRERKPGLPCILISGAVTDEIKTRAKEVGVCSVFAKPLNFDHTLESIWTALEQTYDWCPARTSR